MLRTRPKLLKLLVNTTRPASFIPTANAVTGATFGHAFFWPLQVEWPLRLSRASRSRWRASRQPFGAIVPSPRSSAFFCALDCAHRNHRTANVKMLTHLRSVFSASLDRPLCATTTAFCRSLHALRSLPNPSPELENPVFPGLAYSAPNS